MTSLKNAFPTFVAFLADLLLNNSVDRHYKAISAELFKFLLGFHALTVCNQTGRFNAKTKTFRRKQFFNAYN